MKGKKGGLGELSRIPTNHVLASLSPVPTLIRDKTKGWRCDLSSPIFNDRAGAYVK